MKCQSKYGWTNENTLCLYWMVYKPGIHRIGSCVMFGNLFSGRLYIVSQEERCAHSHSWLLLHQWMGHLVDCGWMGVWDKEKMTVLLFLITQWKKISKCQLSYSVLTMYHLWRFGINKVGFIQYFSISAYHSTKFWKEPEPLKLNNHYISIIFLLGYHFNSFFTAITWPIKWRKAKRKVQKIKRTSFTSLNTKDEFYNEMAVCFMFFHNGLM